jgi:hypothetical protein
MMEILTRLCFKEVTNILTGMTVFETMWDVHIKGITADGLIRAYRMNFLVGYKWLVATAD